MKEKIKYIIPPSITIVILLFAYAIRRIYPFGNETIIYADLGQVFINNFVYYINTIKSMNFENFLYSDLVYGGTNILTSALPAGFFSPLSLMYLLCNNSNELIYFSSYILIMKLAISSITSFYCFEKLFKNNWKLNVLFSLLYVFSSYCLINYTNIIWLDIIIVYPLLVLSLKRIIENKGFWIYSVLLAVCLMISYQLTYMIIFSILATIIFWLKEYNENKKKIIFNLGIGTIIGLLIPSAIFFPGIKGYLESCRTEFSSTSWDSVIAMLYTKIAYMLFSAVLLYSTIKAFKYVSKDKIINKFAFMIAIVGIIPIWFDGINRLWHGGSYMCFPFRYGFIPLFYMNLLANYYFQTYFNIDVQNNEKIANKHYFWICVTIAVFYLIVAGFSILFYVAAFCINAITVLVLVIYNLCMFIILDNVTRIYKVNYKCIIFIVSIVEIIVFSVSAIGVPIINDKAMEHTSQSLISANEITSDLATKLDYESGYRYRDNAKIMLENTGLYSNLPMNSSWILVNKEQYIGHNALGYDFDIIKMGSLGGTIFSDSLLGVKYVFSKEEMDNELYNYIDETKNGIKLYEFRYNFQHVIPYNTEKCIEGYPKNIDLFEYQNNMYKNFFNKDDDIFEINCLNEYDIENKEYNDEIVRNKEGNILNSVMEFDVKIDNKKILYIWEGHNFGEKIFINDEFKDVKNISGIIELGIFENENVNIKILYNNNVNMKDSYIAELDVKKYIDLFKNINKDIKYSVEGNKINISLNNQEKDKSLFIPITYDEKWNVKLNGKEAKISKVLDSMISIELEQGKNDITLEFTNDTIKHGAIISTISIILLVIFSLLRKKLNNCEVLLNISYSIFIITDILFFVIVYGYGLIKSFIL